jgi:hypothetical protein
MAFDAEVLLLVALLEITLPGHTIRLCDGGFVNWPARGMFDSADPVFGTIESAEGVAEAISDEAPGGSVTLLPPDLSVADDLFRTDAQGSAVKLWMASVDRQTGLIAGDPELLFDGRVDTLTVTAGRGTRKVVLNFASSAERLFMVMEGVALAPRWHKAIWPGELGLDHVTGTGVAVAWGVAGPPRGSVSGATPIFGGGALPY